MTYVDTLVKTVRFYIQLALPLVILINYLPYVSGSVYDVIRINSINTPRTPSIVLQNGTDNVSLIYANNTSAKISINVTSIATVYNYSLNIKSNESSTRLIMLEPFNYTGISKINATIGFYDNSTFEKQIIIEGENVTEIGSYYNLASFSTVHIRIADLEENITDGTAYLHTYLRIRIPNTSTYTLYVITFEFK